MIKFHAQKDGFYHPAEWVKHEATWLNWPQNKETWKGEELPATQKEYARFIGQISISEKVRVLVHHEQMENQVKDFLENVNILNEENIEFVFKKTNDAWMRDCGPDFLLHKERKEKILLNWEYNAWGGKYPPFEDDNAIPAFIAKKFGYSKIDTDFVLEGGSFEVNEFGDLLTTKSCLLNDNRNPMYTQELIDEVLYKYLGVKRVIWLGEGIVGDDTDGHIDDFARFVPGKKLLIVKPEDKTNPNYDLLMANVNQLEKMNEFELLYLPIPEPIRYYDDYLPASYANYCVTNKNIIVPIFGDKNDEKALDLIQSVYPDREVVGLMSRDIIVGLGSFHCLSKQEPAIL